MCWAWLDLFTCAEVVVSITFSLFKAIFVIVPDMVKETL